MKIVIIDGKKARLTPTGGKIRDRLSNREYSEATVPVTSIWRYEDSDTVHYEETPVDTLPDEVKAVFDQVVQLIVNLAMSYGAMDDLRNLENVNISSLFALAHDKGVTESDMQALIMQVVMLKTDIEAKFPRSWYDTWNGNLKPYLVEAITQAKTRAEQNTLESA